MKTSGKWIACGTSALFAAALSLTAQTSTTKQQSSSETATRPSSSTSTSSTSTPPSSSTSTDQQASSASTPSSSSQAQSSSNATSNTTSNAGSLSSSTTPSSSSSSSQNQNTPGTSAPSSSSASGSLSGSASGSASGSLSASGSATTQPGSSSSTATATDPTSNASNTGTQRSQAGVAATQQSSTQQSATTQSTLTASAQAETQVTTLVQQLDTQGPVVIERVTTQFSDVTCSPENARMLIEALHGGTSVTLSADGKTATFTPSVRLGYGEAYIALALAAETLRGAGITGCATPEQWKAVLLGGPLAVSGGTTTSVSASSTSSFPGILVLHSQGQGWGQIAQTTNVQLGQVVSSARTSFKLEDKDAALAPTGRTSAEMEQERKSRKEHPGKSEGAPYGNAYGHDKDKAHDKTDGDKTQSSTSDKSDRADPTPDAAKSNR